MRALIYFIVAVTLIVGIHELGHYAAAKCFGVTVKRYSIGFGKVIARRVWRGTEWCISLVPLGGYVSMLDSRVEPVVQEERSHAFDYQKPWKKIMIYGAGPAVNLLLGVLIFTALFFFQGVSSYRPIVMDIIPDSLAAKAHLAPGDTVLQVNGEKVGDLAAVNLAVARFIEDDHLTLAVKTRSGERVTRDLQPADYPALVESLILGNSDFGILPFAYTNVLGEVVRGSPAAKAGLVAGDVILELGGEKISNFWDLTRVTQSHPEVPLKVLYKRDGEVLTTTVTPKGVKTGKGSPLIGQIGVKNKIDQKLANINRLLYYPSLLTAGRLAAARTWELSELTVVFIGKMIIGESSLKRVSGPFTMASYAGQSAKMGFSAYLTFLALISISIGVLNLLPVPILDGGGILYAAIEWVKGSPLSRSSQELGFKLGLLFVVFLMLVAFFNDFIRILG